MASGNSFIHQHRALLSHFFSLFLIIVLISLHRSKLPYGFLIHPYSLPSHPLLSYLPAPTSACVSYPYCFLLYFQIASVY